LKLHELLQLVAGSGSKWPESPTGIETVAEQATRVHDDVEVARKPDRD